MRLSNTCWFPDHTLSGCSRCHLFLLPTKNDCVLSYLRVPNALVLKSTYYHVCGEKMKVLCTKGILNTPNPKNGQMLLLYLHKQNAIFVSKSFLYPFMKCPFFVHPFVGLARKRLSAQWFTQRKFCNPLCSLKLLIPNPDIEHLI